MDDWVDTLSLGITFNIRMNRTPARAATQNVPPTVAPQAEIVTAPRPALPIELTLTASSHFDFDKAELKQAGREALDNLAQEIRTLAYDVVLVTGHTDRIGTRQYNLALSERRAMVVKDYLMSIGIPETRITIRGVNSDEPLIAADQCRGTGSVQAQIACLQPDRRVVVLVSGMRQD